MEKFVIVDGNSLVNRAFYALPSLRSLDGRICNAVYGFVNMILNVITKEKPKYFVCAFDAGKHTFRNDMYADYKGTREGMPEDLASQLPILKELLHAMGIKIIEKKEIEADDIVGSLTRKFNEEFIILSGDRDLLQLINDHTSVWLTKKGVNDVLKVDEKVLFDEFGIKPYQVIELKSIQGDSSDNIPGVKGIGEKGAKELITKYGNLDNVYAHVDEVRTQLKNKLLEHKDTAYLSHALATIKLDVDLDVELEDCELHLPFGREAYDIMYNLDFRTIISRKELFSVDVMRHGASAQSQVLSEIKAEIIEINSVADLREMEQSLGDSFAVTSDNMTLSFGFKNKEYILYKTGEVFAENLDILRDLFANSKQKICFDTKSLMHELDNFGIKINNYFDVSLAIYIANELDAEISLSDALKLNQIKTNSQANALFVLKEIYVEKLIKTLQLKLFSDIELPLVEVLFDMEKSGVTIDANQIRILSQGYHEELNGLVDTIYKLAGQEFNLNSPKQLQDILFNKLKIEYNGKMGTSIEVLNAIADKHEIVKYIIRYRKISKLISTYLDGMLNFISPDGKVHTTFMQRTTSTGRLSSREPNLQNLPIRDDEGRALRKMFSSSFEYGTMVSADYSQIELRLIANFSGDETMIADYMSGKDIHAATASKIFGVDIEDVTPSMRRVAKSVNFGIIYGISAYGLSQSLNISQKEANEFIKKYLSIYPKVKEYGEKCISSARELGYSKTIMGRTRHIEDLHSRNHVIRAFAERTAKNMPLQGSASDIIKVAMIRVFKRMKEEGLKSKLVLQIHDELVVDCFKGESEKVKKILKEEMEGVVDLQVPLIVNVSEGKTLYDAK